MSGPLFKKVGQMNTIAFRELMEDVIDERLEEKLSAIQFDKNNGNNKKKRAPSKYNLFIGDCMKEDGMDMKACVKRWNEEKKK